MPVAPTVGQLVVTHRAHLDHGALQRSTGFSRRRRWAVVTRRAVPLVERPTLDGRSKERRPDLVEVAVAPGLRGHHPQMLIGGQHREAPRALRHASALTKVAVMQSHTRRGSRHSSDRTWATPRHASGSPTGSDPPTLGETPTFAPPFSTATRQTP